MIGGRCCTVLLLLTTAISTVMCIRSPVQQTFWAQTELKIYRFFESNSGELSAGADGLVRQYLQDLQKSYHSVWDTLKSGLRNDNKFALTVSKNPILLYQMVTRYVNLLHPIHQSMSKYTSKQFFKTFGMEEDEMIAKWPTSLDLDSLTNDIIQTQHIYNFDIEQFAQGNIMGIQTIATLRTTEAAEIGAYAIRNKMYSSAILWLETALSLLGNSSHSHVGFKQLLQAAMKSHDDAWHTRSLANNFFFEHKTINTKSPRRTLREALYEKHKGKQNGTMYMDVNMWGVCSGETHLTLQQQSELHCWLDTKSNHAWKICPLKIELVSKSPRLIQYHDIIRDKRIEILKAAGIPAIKPTSQAAGDTIGRLDTNIYVHDKYFAGHIKDDSNALSLSKYLEYVTGMNVVGLDSGENFQVVAYPFGGRLGTHLDHIEFMENYPKYGNRIASMLFYLDNVEVGGFTGFPIAGVAARPVKGSAILFFNTYLNGSVDPRTIHGGCPIVLGHKWLATKLMRSFGQMFTKPCGLSPME